MERCQYLLSFPTFSKCAVETFSWKMMMSTWNHYAIPYSPPPQGWWVWRRCRFPPQNLELSTKHLAKKRQCENIQESRSWWSMDSFVGDRIWRNVKFRVCEINSRILAQSSLPSIFKQGTPSSDPAMIHCKSGWKKNSGGWGSYSAFKSKSSYYHGNLRVPPLCHPPQEIRPY